MIVDCAVYQGGRRGDVPAGDLQEAFDRVRDSGDDRFVWVGLHEPGERDFSQLTDTFHLHSLAVEDAVEAHQRPKLERHGDSHFLVLKTLHYVEEHSAIEVGEIMVFFGPGFVITVRHGEGNPLSEVRRRLESDPERLRYGPGAVVHAVCDQIVDTYSSIADEIDHDVEEVEQSVFSPARTTRDAERIYSLKRQVLSFRRAVLPLSDPMQTFVSDERINVAADMRPFFRDVADHVVRVSEQVEGLDALLTSALNANLSRVTVEQNDTMRRITAAVAIISAPTLVFSMYGMNFDYLPGLQWHYAFFAVVGGLVIFCTAAAVGLRRGGWL